MAAQGHFQAKVITTRSDAAAEIGKVTGKVGIGDEGAAAAAISRYRHDRTSGTGRVPRRLRVDPLELRSCIAYTCAGAGKGTETTLKLNCITATRLLLPGPPAARDYLHCLGTARPLAPGRKSTYQPITSSAGHQPASHSTNQPIISSAGHQPVSQPVSNWCSRPATHWYSRPAEVQRCRGVEVQRCKKKNTGTRPWPCRPMA